MVSNPASAGAKPPERLGAAVRHVARALACAGVPEAGSEARRLVQQAAGLPALVLATEPERMLSAGEADSIAAMLARRMTREPLGRIAGVRDFYGRPFRLSPATLEPRADTETLIEAVLEIVAAEGWRDRPLDILDLGTGTGCILLTLLAELPRARGLGIDIAAEAVATAEENARRLGLAERARFEVGDGPEGLTGPFDLVVSNPPYIPSADIAGLDPEVRDFDPRAALDGLSDGLAFYRAWIPVADTLAPRGWLVFEIGAGQADAVASVLRGSRPANRLAGEGPETVRRWLDLGGHSRVVAIGPQLTLRRD